MSGLTSFSETGGLFRSPTPSWGKNSSIICSPKPQQRNTKSEAQTWLDHWVRAAKGQAMEELVWLLFWVAIIGNKRHVSLYAWSPCLGVLTFLFHHNYQESKWGSTQQIKASLSFRDPVTASRCSSNEYKILIMAVKNPGGPILSTSPAKLHSAHLPSLCFTPTVLFQSLPSSPASHLRAAAHAVPSAGMQLPPTTTAYLTPLTPPVLSPVSASLGKAFLTKLKVLLIDSQSNLFFS